LNQSAGFTNQAAWLYVSWRREGGYFTLLVQFQGKQCFMTYLEDYKTNAAGAQPYLTLTFFDDLLETKSLALLRGEVTNNLTRPEAKVYVWVSCQLVSIVAVFPGACHSELYGVCRISNVILHDCF